jgi:hypothetical protein
MQTLNKMMTYLPLKHQSTKESHTKIFVGFSDLVILWQENTFQTILQGAQ